MCLRYDFLQRHKSSLGNALGDTLRLSSQPPGLIIYASSRGSDDDEMVQPGPPDFIRVFREPDGDEYEGPDHPDTEEPGWWRGFRLIPVPAIEAEIVELFYPDHDPDGLLGSPGKWYLGKIVSRSIEMGQLQWSVEFEDGETQPYTDEQLRNNNNDVRVLSSPNSKFMFVGAGPDPHGEGTGRTGRTSTCPGPWETWLKTYLTDMLLSIFRADRRKAHTSQVDKDHLRGILHPYFSPE